MTPALVAEHGLTPEEYDRVVAILGRAPTFTELGIVSALWSEHCSYKHSRPLLRTLPTSAPHVLQGPGENAGVIAIGDGLAVAFKIESHNHPSAVEPYQGAATGVGGILRDVFTMGARPIALLDSLRFGSLESPRVRYLFAGVVKGIGDYGNCVGIPNIGGEVYFDHGYDGNPIVNAMCIGLLKKDELIRGEASGVGNTVMAVGSRTGRDGIHGATFASEELGEHSEQSRPQVQVGDPFTEKLLLEASLELIKGGHLAGIQDMGAAGLTSSASEMAARAGTGIDIDVAHVPVRERGMTPYEILLSESQERMLVVARRGHEGDVREILEKWELRAAEIGKVTDDGCFRVRENGRVVAAIPALPLVKGCPAYEREGTEAEEIQRLRALDLSTLPLPATGDELTEAFLTLLGSPTIASKRWVYEQYDSTVRTGTVIGPSGDAGVLRIRGYSGGIAATTDCNGRYVYLRPRRGTMIAVAEAARNLVCVGALPVAVTNNLNFGNPLKPEIYYQFRESILGLAEACRHFETPVTGGNVSFYNEYEGRAIYPTPVIGMIGLVDRLDLVVRHGFAQTGDAIILLGTNRGELGGSEYLYRLHDLVAGEPPTLSLVAERELQRAVLALSAEALLSSAHDCAEGGLAVCLAESAIADPEAPLGLTVTLGDALAPAPLLFGECQGRIVASCEAAAAARVLDIAERYGVPAKQIGVVAAPGEALVINTRTARVEVNSETLARVYYDSIPSLMQRPALAEVSAAD
ncbi:MAG: phosphoribosylformylglycinamidine synthase subunit PurL [Gemmatimonadetes bacterium]|nr:phosphoribosylformylglycinamidine synthase subunit PurL [Gemmatimonadota bacterium]